MSQPNQFELSTPPEDVISALTFSPSNHSRLLVSSWDKHVHLYDTNAGLNGSRLATFPHAAAVLDCCFGESDNEMFSGGLDRLVRQWVFPFIVKGNELTMIIYRLDPETSKGYTLASHLNAVKSVCYNTQTKSLLSGSWDHTIKHIDPRAPEGCGLHRQPNKIFSLSTIAHILVVAMSSRSVYLYDLRNMSSPWQRRESSLKFMTRTVRCMPNSEGYASSSIEGRVAVEFFDPSDESQKRKYAFKCHRQVENGVDVIYPVNALAFHPVYGTFASGGGDGVVSLWDGMAKRRLRQYQKYPASIAGLSFSNNGKHLAIGTSSGFESNDEGTCPPESIKIFVRELQEGEGKAKGLPS